MARVSIFATILAFLLLSGTFQTPTHQVEAQQKKFRKRLPNYWGSLGLSLEQKKKIYQLQEDYFNKIASLEKQIADLKKEERVKSFEVLTSAQKENLRKILLKKGGALPKETTPKSK